MVQVSKSGRGFDRIPVGCGRGRDGETTMREMTLILFAVTIPGAMCGCNDTQAPAPSAPKIEVPISEKGYCYRVYDVAGWNRDSIRKAWGVPTKVIKEREDFKKGINDKPKKLWSQLKDEEVEQWFYLDKSGLMQTLVTFDAKGNAVRAIREWSDW
jgi:hypothetical protein